MFEAKKSLIPGAVVANVQFDEFVHVVEFVLPQRKRLDYPLTILPSVIVFRVAFEYFFDERELLARVLQAFDHIATMLPNLIVLRVVSDYVADKVQFFRQVLIQLLEQYAPVVPDRIIGRIEQSRVFGELERTFALFFQLHYGPKVVEHILECFRVRDATNFVRFRILNNNKQTVISDRYTKKRFIDKRK